MTKPGSTGNVIAAVCSFFVPGLGQLVQGRIFAALAFFIFTSVGYMFWIFVIPGIVAAIGHLCAIIDAAKYEG